MKQAIVSTLVLALALSVMAGCMTSGHGHNLYDEATNTKLDVADVLKRWEAGSMDSALVWANSGLQLWTEKRGAYLVKATEGGVLEEPVTIRILAWYDNVLASIRADIDFLTALKAKADAIKPAQ